MSSYLEAYGAAEARHEKRLHVFKIVCIVLACLLVAGLILYGIFRNYSEEQEAKTFVDLLRSRNYQSAYQLWGCSDATPCTGYPFNKFLEDWGPQSQHADESSARVGSGEACGSGVMIRIDYSGSQEPVLLWIERGSKTISFAPFEECPGRRLRIGAFWRSLFKR